MYRPARGAMVFPQRSGSTRQDTIDRGNGGAAFGSATAARGSRRWTFAVTRAFGSPATTPSDSIRKVWLIVTSPLPAIGGNEYGERTRVCVSDETSASDSSRALRTAGEAVLTLTELRPNTVTSSASPTRS